MQSTMMSFVRRSGCAPKTFNSTTRMVTIALAGLAIMILPAAALVSGADNTFQHRLTQNSPMIAIAVRRGPVHHSWRPDEAIAAGAAIDFVAAITAAAWAGALPAPGYRCYDTDPKPTQGFWDVCP